MCASARMGALEPSLSCKPAASWPTDAANVICCIQRFLSNFGGWMFMRAPAMWFRSERPAAIKGARLSSHETILLAAI
mgnify:CR=1 FL=1